MANNYTQFSLALNIKSAAEKTWWEDTLRAAADTEVDETGGSGADFDYEVSDTEVWFHDDGEQGNLEQIEGFVQAYLKKFNPKGYFVIEWASTCSKARVGEFGGGLAVVTAKKTHWFQGYQWVQSKTKGLKSAGNYP